MTLHEVRGPELPVAEKGFQHRHAPGLAVTSKQFSRGWRRSGPGIEERNIDLPPREGLINYGQISDNQGQNSKTDTSFYYNQHTSQTGVRNDIAQTQSREGRAAHVQAGFKARQLTARAHGQCDPPLQQRERKD